MREIELRPRAQLDLESIFIHLALELAAPAAARLTVGSLYAAFDRIAEIPTLGMAFTNDDLEREYRRTLVKSYWVYYTFDDERVIIWRIFHTRQDINTQTLSAF